MDREIGVLEGIPTLDESNVKHLRHGIDICNQNLLFDQSVLCEVALNIPVYPIPNMPPWLHGLINLRGDLVPTFNIDGFISEDTKTERENKNSVFVIGQGTDAIGLLIDKLPITLEIDEENAVLIDPPEHLPEIFSDGINKAYKIEQDIWLEIDIATIINNINLRHSTNPVAVTA